MKFGLIVIAALVGHIEASKVQELRVQSERLANDNVSKAADKE